MAVFQSSYSPTWALTNKENAMNHTLEIKLIQKRPRLKNTFPDRVVDFSALGELCAVRQTTESWFLPTRGLPGMTRKANCPSGSRNTWETLCATCQQRKPCKYPESGWGRWPSHSPGRINWASPSWHWTNSRQRRCRTKSRPKCSKKSEFLESVRAIICETIFFLNQVLLFVKRKRDESWNWQSLVSFAKTVQSISGPWHRKWFGLSWSLAKRDWPAGYQL